MQDFAKLLAIAYIYITTSLSTIKCILFLYFSKLFAFLTTKELADRNAYPNDVLEIFDCNQRVLL